MRWWDIDRGAARSSTQLFPDDAWSPRHVLVRAGRHPAPGAPPGRYVVAGATGRRPDRRLRGARRDRRAPATCRPSRCARDHWGTGLGARLLTDAAAGRDRRGLRTRCCSRCGSTTPRAQRLYQRFGFEPIGIRKRLLPAGQRRRAGDAAATDAAHTSLTLKDSDPMADEPLVLGIETSCDETGVGIVRGTTLLADAVASSVDEHARFGGVVPEVATRAHLEAMVPTIQRALKRGRGQAPRDLDAHRGDRGPRPRGALLVGVVGGQGVRATRSASRSTASTTSPRTSASTSSSTARCPSRRWRCWSPAATPRCCWSPTSPATSGRWARPSTTRPARPSTRSPGCSGLGFPGGPVIDRDAARGRPGGDRVPARPDRRRGRRRTTSPSPG